LDSQSGNKTGQRGVVKGTEPSHSKKNAIYGDYSMVEGKYGEPKDGLGGASRFFYCPKANKSDRNEGMPEPVPQFTARPRREDGTIIYKETHPEEWAEAMKGKPRREKTSLAASEEILQPTTKGTMNVHPTVKPTDLMTYLIRLVTPKGGIVLDPFMGSGSTGKAAIREGFNFVGIEREKEYMEIAQQRIEWEAKKQNPHNWF
jgi:site-specific DNA-methyltransferase (adenine-specific)